jgi:hypothetical protein
MNLGVKRSVLIVDNYAEFLSIISLYPNLKNIYVVLLSRNFTISEIALIFDTYNASWFDEHIDRVNAKKVIDEKNDFLWKWFLDENDRDLSEINGCSLGSAFVQTLSMLLNSVLRYKAGFGKILMEKDNVYFLSNTEDIFIDVINFLHKKIGFKLISIDHKKNKKILYGNINIDLDGRKRDLFNIFNKSKFTKSFIAYILDKFQTKPSGKKNRVLFMHSGKMEVFIKYSCNTESENEWTMPVMSTYDMCINLLKRKSLFYQFYPFSLSKQDALRVNNIIDILKKNINKNIYIDSDLLIRIMDRYIFNVFLEAYGYYSCVLDKIQLLKPKAIIYSSESLELTILAAQAGKKKGVKNIIMAHGLVDGGETKNKIGQFGVFDYALAFGNFDANGYRYLGMKKDNIKIASFPYFEKFLPIKNSTGTKRYINALVLGVDFANDYTDKMGRALDYYQNIFNLLEELEINLSAIKLRHNLFSRVGGGVNNEVNINGKIIPLLSGYSSFKEHAQNADLIIGPASTAIIEAGLMGKDYFVYKNTDIVMSEVDSTRWPFLEKHMYVSYSIDQLRENIENNRVYKNGFSVNDFVDLSKINNRKDLFKKFNMVVNNIINDSKV